MKELPVAGPPTALPKPTQSEERPAATGGKSSEIQTGIHPDYNAYKSGIIYQDKTHHAPMTGMTLPDELSTPGDGDWLVDHSQDRG
ncbi:MAG: hypothetical protein M1426_05350 [Patescibacteria group bacterium]|nr:hypothetical protein [Patescibacteria group bacterium]